MPSLDGADKGLPSVEVLADCIMTGGDPAGPSTETAVAWSVPWAEPACLVRSRLDLNGRSVEREIIMEGSFADVADLVVRCGVDQWASLTISFTERRQPPFRYEADDFVRHVLSPMLRNPPAPRRR